MSFRQIRHTVALAIVHGKSEMQLAQYIKSTLRLPFEIIAKDKGKHSIQINSVNADIFNGKPFKSMRSFTHHYPGIDINKKQLNNFKIFIIMDTDDATKDQIKRFKNGEMFAKYWFSKYIVPIWNEGNLEDILKKMEYPFAKNKQEKRVLYKEFFSPKRGEDDFEFLRKFADDCRKNENTNMEVFLDYCLRHK